MAIKKLLVLVNLIILTNSLFHPRLHPLINIHNSKPSKCIADLLNSISAKDIHFLIINTNFVTSFRALDELSQTNNPRSYTIMSTSDLIVPCIQNREINVYLIFLSENENFGELLNAIMNFCSWNPVAKVFIVIRHYDGGFHQNRVYYELFRRLIFNVIVVEISSLKQKLITVSSFFL